MKENVLRLGPDGRLLGIQTVPERPYPGAPAFLLMNAGVVHRIGPHRLNVKLARSLAGIGVSSLRLDLSALGDSPPAPGAAHFGEQALLDLKAAMDHLESTQGVQRFVLFGVCSGAVNGYHASLADPRVVGLLMFDGFVYPTMKTHLLRRWKRLRSLSWASLGRKILQKFSVRRQGAPAQDDAQTRAPTRQEFALAMDTLVARGVGVYLLYSGSFLESHNYRQQLRDAFGRNSFVERIRYDFMPEVDHTATSLAAQRKVISAACDWVQSLTRNRPSVTEVSRSSA